MAQYPAAQITNKQRIMGNMVFFTPEGSAKAIKLGPINTVDFTPTIAEVESRSNEWGDNRLIGTFTTTKDGSVNLNGIQMWTQWLYSALFMSNVKYINQASLTAEILDIEAITAGDLVRVPAYNATNVSISDASSTVYVEDTHYTFHKKTGMVEILEVPAGADSDAEVTYDQPAITDADKLLDLEVLETSGTRGKLTVIGIINQTSGTQEEVEMVFPDVEFRPQGAIPSGDTNALNEGSLTGRVYSTSANGFGYVRSLPQS